MIRQGYLVAMVLGGAFLVGCGGSTSPPPIFLGHIATLSGPDARAGKSAEQGIRLALEELGPAASANLQGRPLVVRHVDAAGSLDNMEAQAARLVSVNKAVGFLGGVTKEEALRLDRSRVPVLSPAGFRTSAMSELLFTTGLAPATQGEVLAQFLAEDAPTAGTLIVDPRRELSSRLGRRLEQEGRQGRAAALGRSHAAQRRQACGMGNRPPWGQTADHCVRG